MSVYLKSIIIDQSEIIIFLKIINFICVRGIEFFLILKYTVIIEKKVCYINNISLIENNFVNLLRHVLILIKQVYISLILY